MNEAHQPLCLRLALATLLTALESHQKGEEQDWEGMAETVYDMIEAFPDLRDFQHQADRICGNYYATV